MLQFGTEVVTSEDGTIAGLLGASPGASTAASIMLGLLRTCFPERMPQWEGTLRELIPSFGTTLNPDAAAADASLTRTADALGIAR